MHKYNVLASLDVSHNKLLSIQTYIYNTVRVRKGPSGPRLVP
jgi:hypothetical protein